MTPFIAAILALIIGLALVLRGRMYRTSRGFGQGRTVALDNRRLYSSKYGLTGRPDRIIEGNIPEEWKRSQRVHDSHRAQMGVYFILLEEETGVRPPHGFIVTGDGSRHRIENDERLRAWVLGVADQIRVARANVEQAIPVNPPPAKCRTCGQRGNCGQART